MFIPLRTEVAPKRSPLITPWLIGSNVAISLVLLLAVRTGSADVAGVIDRFSLSPGEWISRPWQLVSYTFLHDLSSPWHLLFNMLFLWVFGTAVEGRLGRVGFLLFYLSGGMISGLTHVAFSPAPVIGASGAVAAVSGAFLALFPRANIRVLFFFFVIGIYSVPALWFIVFYLAIDILSQITATFGGRSSNVAYMAHIGGYVYGFAVAVGLLATHVLPREDFDIFFLFTQWRRRAVMRAAVEEARRRTPVLNEDAPALPVAPPPTIPGRAEVDRLWRDRDLDGAASAYRELLATHPDLTFPEDQQLDLANQFMQRHEDETAATAYELLLKRHPHGARADEVRLLLGVLYTRRVPRPDRARELIEAVRSRLRDPQQSDLADTLLKELAT